MKPPKPRVYFSATETELIQVCFFFFPDLFTYFFPPPLTRSGYCIWTLHTHMNIYTTEEWGGGDEMGGEKIFVCSHV